MTRIARYLRFAVLGKNEHPRRPRRRRVGYRGPARDAGYRTWVRTLPCAACGSDFQVEAAHTGSDGGTALKASDYSCVPLCRGCHTGNPRSYHAIGRERFATLWSLDFGELVTRLNAAWESTRRGGRVA